MSIMFTTGIHFFPTSEWEWEGFTEFLQGSGPCVFLSFLQWWFSKGGKVAPSFGEREFLSPSSWTKNQIDLRQINKRKSNLLVYFWGLHTGIEILKTVRQVEVYLSFWTKEEGWASEARNAIHREIRRADVWYVDVCPAIQMVTWIKFTSVNNPYSGKDPPPPTPNLHSSMQLTEGQKFLKPAGSRIAFSSK